MYDGDTGNGCRIPSGLDLETVCRNIKSALREEGYLGNVSITAYGTKDHVGDNILPDGFTLKPHGEDMDCYSLPLTFFSEHEDYNALVALPQTPSRELTRTVAAVWRWGRLSTGEKPFYSINNIWTRFEARCPTPEDLVGVRWHPRTAAAPACGETSQVSQSSVLPSRRQKQRERQRRAKLQHDCLSQ
ncbi:unnamed protein product [Arabis nemorensis]|uniref:Uncharacterized protein n=1 Tax=Arabis nemorensis TaxID=586526 RepID=A0A565ARS4_9BRAS|nr:unnamed protein product [Arabis nemorensis]